jgi:Zn finger protein HypA/HybF involved in hydrogenase expression
MKNAEFECMECHRKMTVEEAELALEEGCPGCGGCDIDIALD